MSQKDVAARTLPYMIANERAQLDLGFWTSANIAPYQNPASCGTTLCAAGWVGHLLGYHITLDGSAMKSGEKTREVASVAQEALELSDEQAYWLFQEANEDEVIRCFDEMADGLGFPQGLVPHVD